MRAALVALAVLVAVTIVGWFVLHTRGERTVLGPEPVAPAVPVAEAKTEGIAASAPDVRREQAAVVPVPSADLAPATSSTGPRSIVFGRCMDEEGHPVAGVVVRMTSVDGPWARGQTVPIVEHRGHKMEEFSMTTGEDGRFRFDAPVPTSDWISLYGEAPPYFGIAGRDFGPAGGRDQSRLVEGDNDVGDLAFMITGAVRGRVSDESGRPVSGAHVSLDGSFPGGFGVGAETETDGSYLMGHVPAGSARIDVEARGFLSAKAGPVMVEKRTTSEAPTVIVSRAPSISGVIVDQAGNPVPKAFVEGWPTSSGRAGTARTDGDGRFTMYLPQNEPYRLEVSREEQFEPWGGFEHPDAVFEPGRNDVRIVLVRAMRTTFAVIDAESGTAIERFGITICDKGKGSDLLDVNPGTPRVEDHPGGTLTMSADPAQHTLAVLAPGYAPLQAAVAHDAGAEKHQTLRLVRGGAFVGRVMHDGAPVAQATLVLEHDTMKIDPSKPDDEDDIFSENLRTDLGALAGRRQRLAAEKDGRFRIPDLAPGTYKLAVSGGKAAPKILRALRIEGARDHDLGTVELVAGASVRGRVLLGAGLSPAGLEVRLDDDWERRIPVGVDGSLLLDGIAPGDHKLVLEREPPTVLEEVPVAFSVAAGETREVVLDARGNAPCTVIVHVLRGGRPAAGIDVAVETGDEQYFNSSNDIGKTGDDGSVSGSVAGGRRTRFAAKGDNGFVLGRSKPEIMPAGGTHEPKIAITSGDLVVEFAATFRIPDNGGFEVMLRTKGGPEEESPQWTQWQTPSIRETGVFGKAWKERRCAIGPVAAGTYSLMMNVYSSKHVDNEQGGYWSPEPLMPQLESEIAIKEGETTVFEVKSP